MFTLTSAAARQIQQAASASDAQDMALRVAARLDSDGSMQYGMGFDDAKDEDMKLDLDRLAVVIRDGPRDFPADPVLDVGEVGSLEQHDLAQDQRCPTLSEHLARERDRTDLLVAHDGSVARLILAASADFARATPESAVALTAVRGPT